MTMVGKTGHQMADQVHFVIDDIEGQSLSQDPSAFVISSAPTFGRLQP
jgi:hypothetical protein